jgi:nicotinamide-nucleotide amidase
VKVDLDRIASRLLELRMTVATAESCTGGLLGAALTSVPGASAWYRGGLVVYSDDLKVQLAGVRTDTLATCGAVSLEVACELARGVRQRCNADLGVGITGIAGPGGGTTDKPVGTVCVAIASASEMLDWSIRLPGDREEVRQATVRFVLERIGDMAAAGPDKAR